MTITVCIVDDNKDIRSALEQIVIMSDGYRLLASFSSAEEAIEKIPALNFDEKVARTYSEIYAFFLKPRNKSGTNVHDLQIASTALAHGFPLLTSNVRDFEKIPGLNILTIS